MNDKRRKEINNISNKISVLLDELSHLKDEEDDVRNNMPDNFENSNMYELSEQCSDVLEDVISEITEQLEILKEEIL